MTPFEIKRRSVLLENKDIAQELKTSKQVVSHWATGRMLPSNKHLPKLAKLFKMSVPNLVKLLDENQRHAREEKQLVSSK